ncbi:MAG: hypothetical protein IEMM0002_1222 [bacterium]|nr:MAG: hypothetical protein IEMM0002_1222 [bacterium]
MCLNVLFMSFCAVENARGETITVRPSLRLQEGWDSNPLYTPDDEDAQSDYLTIVSPQLEIVRDGQKLDWNALYRLDSRYYSRLPEANYLNHIANVGMGMELSRSTSLNVTDSFRYTKNSLEAVEDTGILTRRNDIASNTASLTLNRQLGRAGSANLAFTDRVYDYEDPTLIDTRTDSAAISRIFAWSPRTTLTATYSFAYAYFDAPLADNVLETDSFRLGAAKNLSNSASVNLSGGVVYTPDFDYRMDWTASAGFDKTLRSSTLSLGYARNVTTYTAGLTAELNVSDRATVAWSTPLSDLSNITVSGAYSKNRSEPSGALDTSSGSARIGYTRRLYSWLTASFDYSYFRQWSGGTISESISREMVFAGFTAVPGEWRL